MTTKTTAERAEGETDTAADDTAALVSDLQAVDLGDDFAPTDEDTAQPQGQQGGRDSGVGRLVASVVTMMCGKLATVYEAPPLAMTPEEGEALSEAVEDVAALYEMESSPWVGLALVTGSISIPRYLVIDAITKARAEQERAKTQPQGREGAAPNGD